MSNPSPIHSPLNTSVPKKEEWALINQQKAREYERVQQLEREMNLKKKLELRKQLQKQFNTRTDASLQQREYDRQYYEYISKKTEEMKQQEDRERAERFLKRKQIQQENQHHLGLMQNSRVLSNQEKYKFDIGGRSQQLQREKQVQHKKQMIDTLDKQVKIKADQKRYQKQHQLEIDNKNLQYQFDQFDRRNPHRAYGQNKNVYNYYDFLNRQRQIKEKQLEHIFVDEAAERKKEEERKKIEKKQIQKASKTNEMKEVLQKQVELYHHKMEEQKKTNPQDVQYTVFGSLFREKKIPYDRRQYSEYLRNQAQEQANRKKQEKYMSDQQYRINMNQLNVIFTLNNRKQFEAIMHMEHILIDRSGLLAKGIIASTTRLMSLSRIKIEKQLNISCKLLETEINLIIMNPFNALFDQFLSSFSAYRWQSNS